MKGLDLRKFEKVKSDEHTTTLTHKDGHQITVAHKPLSKAHRKALDELPLAKGGPVDDIPEASQESAAAMQAGFTGKPVKRDTKNKQGDGYSSAPVTHPSPENPKDVKYRESVRKFNEKMGVPDSLAEGGEVGDQQPPEMQMEVPVEVAAPQQDVGMMQGLGHHLGSAVRQSIEDVYGLGKTIVSPIASGVVSGVEGLVQGAAGQPLAPVPTMDTPAPISNTMPAGAPTQSAVAPQAPPQPSAPSGSDYIQNASELEQAAMQDKYKAEVMAGEGKAKAIQEGTDALHKEAAEYENRMQTYQAERQAIFQDLKDQQIDPNHFWNSKDTLGKVGTVIGLLVGGLGGNDMQRVLNSHIERDINSQKANIENKRGVLAALREQFQDANSAAQFHRVMMNDQIAHQIDLAQAKAVTPMAKANLEAAKADLMRKSGTLMAQIGAQQTLNNPNTSPVVAQKALQQLQALDPKNAGDYADRWVPGMGLAPNKEGAKTVKDTQNMVQNARSGITELLEINKIPGKSFSPETRAKANTIQQALVGSLRVPITGPGAMSEGERKMLENLVANPAKIFSLDNNTKVRLETLSRRLEQSLDQTARSNGLQVQSPEQKLPPDQKAYLDWARANPNDPKAKAVFNKLGIK